MAVYLVDSSAIVKRYANENGSAWVMSITDPVAGNEIFVARITGAEVVSALERRARGGTIDPADAAMQLPSSKMTLSRSIKSSKSPRGWSIGQCLWRKNTPCGVMTQCN